MAFTIPNAAGLTYTDQAAPDSGDFAVIAAGVAGFNVASGCAVTASGSSLVLTIQSGAVRFANAPVTVAGNTATVTTAHATDPRYDLVIVDGTGVASIVTGTAASSPAFPTFNSETQVVLAAVYVPAAATALTSANLVDKRWVVPDPSGMEIDTAERSALFDVRAVGTTATDVEGLVIYVPPRSRHYLIVFDCLTEHVSGTAAAAALQGITVNLMEDTSLWATCVSPYTQVSTASRTIYGVIRIARRFPPTSIARSYKIQTRLQQSAVANWTSSKLYAGDSPVSGVGQPMILSAIGL